MDAGAAFLPLPHMLWRNARAPMSAATAPPTAAATAIIVSEFDSDGEGAAGGDGSDGGGAAGGDGGGNG